MVVGNEYGALQHEYGNKQRVCQQKPDDSFFHAFFLLVPIDSVAVTASLVVFEVLQQRRFDGNVEIV